MSKRHSSTIEDRRENRQAAHRAVQQRHNRMLFRTRLLTPDIIVIQNFTSSDPAVSCYVDVPGTWENGIPLFDMPVMFNRTDVFSARWQDGSTPKMSEDCKHPGITRLCLLLATFKSRRKNWAGWELLKLESLSLPQLGWIGNNYTPELSAWISMTDRQRDTALNYYIIDPNMRAATKLLWSQQMMEYCTSKNIIPNV